MAIRQRLGGLLKPYTVSGPGLPEQAIALQIAEALREIATRQGNVPFDKGDLRKAHVVEPVGDDAARLAVNTPYARAVHDGRPAITIRAKRGKALHWKGARHPVRAVRQPARQGNPWLRRAIEQLQSEGLDWLAPQIGEAAAEMLTAALRGQLGGGPLGPNVERGVTLAVRVLKEMRT
ncbi:MAG: hypothetical protein H6981_04535 [Gammaproteobacteria bacterium]|nr:hypothetical protein [Gammaproteobacteria bacterium]